MFEWDIRNLIKCSTLHFTVSGYMLRWHHDQSIEHLPKTKEKKKREEKKKKL